MLKKNLMTKFQALFVKYLRIKCDGSWRWVAAKYEERYTLKIPFKLGMTSGGNQIVGMNLCNEAMNILEEWVEDGWN